MHLHNETCKSTCGKEIFSTTWWLIFKIAKIMIYSCGFFCTMFLWANERDRFLRPKIGGSWSRGLCLSPFFPFLFQSLPKTLSTISIYVHCPRISEQTSANDRILFLLLWYLYQWNLFKMYVNINSARSRAGSVSIECKVQSVGWFRLCWWVMVPKLAVAVFSLILWRSSAFSPLLWSRNPT